MTLYDRTKLVQVLVYHQHTATSGCICGWAVLGASHPEHVADVYEQAIQFDGYSDDPLGEATRDVGP